MNFISASFFTELQRLASLAAPIVVAQVSYMAINVVDVVISGQYGVVDQAGVALGQSVYSPVILLAVGTLMAVSPTVAQLHGAKRTDETGPIVRQALWLSVILAVIVVVIMHNLELLYRTVGVDEVAIPISMDYLRALSFGVPAFLAYFALRNLCEGLAMTIPTMVILLAALALKIPLTYCLVFGIGGFEGLGGEGCGIATAVVFWLMLVAIVVTIILSQLKQSTVFERFDLPDFPAIFKLAKLGFPMGLTIFVEIAFFSVATLFIGRLGVEAVAAHQIVLSIALVGFMISYSMCIATTIRVAFHVGAGSTDKPKITAWVATTIAICLGIVFAIVLLTFRHQLVGIYTSNSEVIALAVPLFFLCSVFLFFDTIQHSFIGVLRGFKDATVPMFRAAISFWGLGIPVGILLTFGLFFEPFGIKGFWYGLILATMAALILHFGRLRSMLSHANQSSIDSGANSA